MFQDMEVVGNLISGGLSLCLAHALIFKGVLLVQLALEGLPSALTFAVCALVMQLGWMQ